MACSAFQPPRCIAKSIAPPPPWEACQLKNFVPVFEDVQRPLPTGAQQAGDAQRFVFSPRDIRHAFQAQFRGTPISPEAIQQQAALRRVDTAQRLFDPAFGDRSQQARFGSVVPQAVTLVAEIQAASFHAFTHRSHHQGGC